MKKPISLIFIFSISLLTACRQDMHDQPRFEPLERNAFFSDHRASRQLIEGTVPRGYLRDDDHFYRGKVNGELVTSFPFEITADVLRHGQERYNIFCTPCHDKSGTGHGMIVERGFRPPPSFHIDRLREAPVGHFYDVMTNGLGAMYSYAERVPPKDRWAIAAYVRTLQLSHNLTVEDIPEEVHQELLNDEEQKSPGAE